VTGHRQLGAIARAGLGSASGLVPLYTAGCLLACAILAISGVMAAWPAALIVAVALLALGGADRERTAAKGHAAPR
jgi:hypothetical protein